jgi:glutathione S-transferase
MSSSSPSAPVLFYGPGTCSFACIVAFEWAALPYSLCRVDAAARGSEAFRRVNPLAKVPALAIDRHFISENAAILTHIAHDRSDLLPAYGTAARDDANMWLSYLGSGFHVAFYPYFHPQNYALDAAHHPAIKAAALEQIRKQLAYVNGHLAARPYLLGRERTLLDGYLHAMSRWTNRLFDLPAEFPYLSAHQQRLLEDPAVQYTLATERGAHPASPSGAFRGELPLDSL